MWESFGIKRLVASLLNLIVEVLRSIPGTGEYISGVEMIAGFFGITGIAHAGKDKTLNKKVIASASAAVAVLIVICSFIPAANTFVPYLQKLAGLLGAAALGSQFARTNPDVPLSEGEVDVLKDAVIASEDVIHNRNGKYT